MSTKYESQKSSIELQKRYYEAFREEERRREEEERQSRESEYQRQQRERDRLYAMGPQDLMVETALLTKELLRRLDNIENDLGETRAMVETIYYGPSKGEDCELWNELNRIYECHFD